MIGARVVMRLVVAVVVCAAAPATASAAIRYASASGTGSACTPGAPCDLVTAINSASSGDTVIVDAGTYGSSGSPITPQLTDNGNDLTISGAVIGPGRPVVYASGGMHLTGTGRSVSDLDLEFSGSQANGLALSGDQETATRMLVNSTSSTAYDACSVNGFHTHAAVVDSVCVVDAASGDSGLGVQVVSTATLRNDTMVGAYGLYVSGSATVVNSILSGSTDTAFFNSSSPALTNDEWSTEFGGGVPSSNVGQVSAPPVFVNAGGGNYHEAANSPSVGAGVDSPAEGTYDLDGDARQVGATTDIGAYQRLGTTSATTMAPSTTASTTVTLTGALDSGGAPASYYWRS